MCVHNNLKHPKVTQPGFHLGAPKKRKVVSNTFLYKRSREILFQKVALGYLLHFVQNGFSRKIYKNTYVCATISKIRHLHGLASIWEHQET